MRLNRTKTAVIVLLVAAFLLCGYAAFAGPGGSDDPLVTQSYVDRHVQWKVADLKTGQALIGSAGSEIILRRGQAVVIDTTRNGIPDVTSGVDIHAGSAVSMNHLLIIPRDDGRGIKAQSPVVVMYRGEAKIR